VLDCPVSKAKYANNNEFLVIVNNPQVHYSHDSFAKVKLPDKNFKAQKWAIHERKFVDVPFQNLEQARFT